MSQASKTLRQAPVVCRWNEVFRDGFFPADYKACEDIVVTGQVLRPAVQDNIAAKFQRALEIWGEERIVNDDQKTLLWASSARARRSVISMVGFVGVSR